MYATPGITSSFCEDGSIVCFTQCCFGILHVVCRGCFDEARVSVLTDICHVTACTGSKIFKYSTSMCLQDGMRGTVLERARKVESDRM